MWSAAHLHDRHALLRLLFVALVMATLVEASVALFEYVDRWSERSTRLGGASVLPLPEGTLGHASALGQFGPAVLGVLACSRPSEEHSGGSGSSRPVSARLPWS